MISGKYSIKDLEVLSGVKAHTIRIWEKRYRLLVPDRTGTNIRYYSDDDLRKIINISLLVKNNYKISRIAAWDTQKIQEEILSLSKRENHEPDHIEQLISFLISFDNQKFLQLINDIISSKGIERAYPEVFFRLLEKVGMYWHAGVLYPAQEHFVFNIFRQKLLAETEKITNSDPGTPVVLFYLHENEMHELSLLYYAYIVHKIGFNTIYLGPQVPFHDLERLKQSARVDHVFTAFINPMPPDTLNEYLHKLSRLFDRQSVFITGLQVQKLEYDLPANLKVIREVEQLKAALLPVL
jgi:MerR family transcriptional regulator, light-induced transcriptional regulator